MRCEAMELWISKCLDNELSVKEVGILRHHMEQCAACRESFADAKTLRAWFVAGPAVAVPPGFAQRVTAQAFAGEQPAATWTRLAGGGSAGGSAVASMDRFAMRFTAVAAALLAALGLALYMQRSTQSRDLQADRNSLQDTLRGLEELNQREFSSQPKAPASEGSQR